MKADASPTKDFFVNTITRDIALKDCVLDLLDNCVDGARRTLTNKANGAEQDGRYKGFRARVRFSKDEFVIEDNCGGISVANAIDYAFHFGRRPDAPRDADFSIGLYGIGMKRAVLKIGTNIVIHSSTAKEAFVCKIDVPDWLKRPEWEFPMDDAALIEGTGTTIAIQGMYQPIAEEFADSAFENELIETISRDYAILISNGFEVIVNDVQIKSLEYKVRTSEEFQPYKKSYDDDGVSVEILAGMASPPPDSTEANDKVDPSYSGWFVVCNDRVVVAADKSALTVWGHEGFNIWHPQYNGFMGIVIFRSDDASRLPWTTTKRAVDETAPLYRRAVNEMKAVTDPWIEYTNRRRADLERAHRIEEEAKSVSLFQVAENRVLKVPETKGPRIRVVSIQYQKPLSEITKAAKALGNENMAASRVGEQTFAYFMKNEVGE